MVYIMGMAIDAIYIIIALEVIGAISFLIFWFWYNKGRFQALICEPYLNTYKIKKKMKIKMTNTEFRWNKFTYVIDFKCAIIDDKGKPIIYYKYEIATPIKTIQGITTNIDSQTFKVVTDGKIMQHLGDKKITKTYMYIIIGCVIMIGLVGIVGIYMVQQGNKDVLRLSEQMMNVTKTIIEQNKPVVITP